MMKKRLFILTIILASVFSYGQTKDSIITFKKKVLETAEINFISSYYMQDGSHAAVSGGIGTEKLKDLASNVIVAIPLNQDDVLTFDAGISAYTSASASNVNPFGGNDDDNVAKTGASGSTTASPPVGTPWQASTGASGRGTLVSLNTNYSHSSDDRNFIWSGDIFVSNEYNYRSFGFGGGITKLFNNKNTEISLKSNIYLDNWKMIYPTELHQYNNYGASSFLSKGYFSGVTVLDQSGAASTAYLPNLFTPLSSTSRNSYSASVGFSQVINTRTQISVFFDILQQQGQLSTPYHRVYFADKANFYVGQAKYISTYASSANVGVYQLADDIERLPRSRFKLPIGFRWNYYVNEKLALRTYYRYYWDNWGLESQTASLEIPYKISDSFTVYPIYRYYVQNAVRYFAPYEQHLSTEQYYTSDYDLSPYSANQYGFGCNYTDIFASTTILGFGIKNVDFRLNHYSRTDGLQANIVTFGVKFVGQ